MAWYNIPMVFNLVFHIIWFSVKGIQALIRRFGPKPIQVQPGGDGPVPASSPAPSPAPAAVGASPAPARRPANHGRTVRRLFLAFALTFVAIHHLVDRILSPAPAPGLAVEAKTCVETDEDNFFCTDDPREARRRARKTAQYYINNFGVAQTIEGNGEENARMRKVADGMDEYFKRWIVRYDHVESLKEKCINKHDKCVFWASIGECTKNPGYMENDCMLACQICEKLLQTPESK